MDVYVVPCNGNVDWNDSGNTLYAGLITSFPAMGTWIEMPLSAGWGLDVESRSLQWERGLKFLHQLGQSLLYPSFPAMGTWIEMILNGIRRERFSSFPAMGTWIEIFTNSLYLSNSPSRSLQWERGLKSRSLSAVFESSGSFPAMGTWIEISYSLRGPSSGLGRSLQWERGLKF